jgi:hypothetical protein
MYKAQYMCEWLCVCVFVCVSAVEVQTIGPIWMKFGTVEEHDDPEWFSCMAGASSWGRHELFPNVIIPNPKKWWKY